jgi:hypothetical protein
MTTYRTKNGQKTGFVPGVGVIADGTITVPDGMILENANLELVEDQQPSQAAPAAPAPSVSATQPVAPATSLPPTPTQPVPQITQTNQETN